MSINILESLSALLPQGVMRQASAVLGETEPNVQSAVHTAGPTLLASLMHDSTDPVRARDLFQTVTSTAVDSSIERKLPGILGDRSLLQNFLGGGEALTSAVFGNRTGGVMQALSQVSGVKPSTASSLLALVTPMLLGLLKKTVSSQGLNTGGLTSLLLGQREHLQSAGLDDRITSALGFANLPNMLGALPSAVGGYAKSAAGAATSAASAATTQFRPAERSQRNWLPWAIAAALVAIAIGLLFNRSGHERVAATQDTTATRLTAMSVYFASGQSAIDPTEKAKLDNLASAARTNGRSLAVTGYADASGDEQQNEALAQERATTVRMALLSSGVPDSQIVMKPPTRVTGSGTEAEARRVEITTVP